MAAGGKTRDIRSIGREGNMNSAIRAAVEDFIQAEKLPDDYLDTVQQWFLPLAEQLLQKAAPRNAPLVVGISGSQGSGKSTLAALLVILLREMMGLRGINLSIDDFYLTHAQRQALAHDVHPLLATRGVPGTHDVGLAVNTLEALKRPGEVAIPRFDKAMDDRCPREQWPLVRAPMDVIVLEGWCLCVEPQTEQELREPVNALERGEDTIGAWRAYVNAQVAGEYQELFGLVDFLVMLRAPGFEKVYEWRQRQEDKLAERCRGQENVRIMTPAQVRRFISHYERLTRHALKTLPARADVVFELTDRQTIAGRID